MAASRVTELQPKEKLLTLDELAAKNRGSTQNGGGTRRVVLSEWTQLALAGNYESALSFFENAVNENPTRSKHGFKWILQRQNRARIAMHPRLPASHKTPPEFGDAHNRLGDAYYYAGSFDKAIASYRQAVRLQPRMAEAYYNLGMAYLEIGDRASAIVQTYVLKSLDTAM